MTNKEILLYYVKYKVHIHSFILKLRQLTRDNIYICTDNDVNDASQRPCSMRQMLYLTCYNTKILNIVQLFHILLWWTFVEYYKNIIYTRRYSELIAKNCDLTVRFK